MRCRVMGILNVTPDSFSDGGRYFERDDAVARGLEMLEAGARIVDVGGESTRPGAEPVSQDEERSRVVPVIAGIRERRNDAVLSIDTMKADVAAAALEAGATFVNDVSAGRDPRMFKVVAEHGASICLMHMRGEPRTMQENPTYGDVVEEVRDELLRRAEAAVRAGVDPARIVIDPGIGFGKTREHNLRLLRRIDAFVQTGLPVLVGASRKSFIGLTLDVPVDERLEGSLGVAAWCAIAGVWAVRVHDVRETARMLEMMTAVAES
ncbi:MAG TPA: dihydropteroate synthase [Gaiellaceae bacterium]|nr:dihydropteroate synthase [Gaiellaceae bacterium]